MKTADRLKGIEEYYFSEKLREIDRLNLQGRDIINLGIGSPDLPPHHDVIRVLGEESIKTNTHGYQGYRGSVAFREAIANWYKLWYNVTLDAGTEILPLMGSKEGIMHICMTYLNAGDKVLVPNPGYPAYNAAIKLAGADSIPYELNESNDYYPDFSSIDSNELEKVKLLFVNYPNMPTGQVGTKEQFKKIVAFARSNNILVVHDNPYSFILNERPLSMLEEEDAMDCVIELNSLSKSHNMAGWRVGMLCGSAEHINQVLKFKSNMDSGMFLPVQLAAAKALGLGMEWYDSINAVYQERRELVFKLLEKLGCVFNRKQAGLFVWARISSEYANGYLLSDNLLKESSLFITPGGIFGSAGEKYIRVSLCVKPERIREAINRIKQQQ